MAQVGEAFMWLFAIAVIVFAATLSERLLLILIIAGLACSALAKVVLWRRRISRREKAST